MRLSTKVKIQARHFFPIAGAILIIALMFAWSDLTSHKEQAVVTTKAEVSQFELAMSRRLGYVIQDVFVLANSSRLLAVIEDKDPKATDYLVDNWIRALRRLTTVKRDD